MQGISHKLPRKTYSNHGKRFLRGFALAGMLAFRRPISPPEIAPEGVGRASHARGRITFTMCPDGSASRRNTSSGLYQALYVHNSC